jgi:pimeloyl-ACP methyl ester carboxylesterase
MWRDIRINVQHRRRLAILGGIVAAGLILTGCGADASRAPESQRSPTAAPSATARIGEVEFDGMTVAYSCVGDGSPAVILEAGSDSPGTQEWPPGFITQIAEVTTVCTYNRLGTGGGSSAPPDHPRTFDDLVSVLDGVLGALELEPPYVIAGQSFGGNIAIAYAAAHPDRVAALVTIEAYRDDPAEMAAMQADEGFTWEDSPEHVDLVPTSVQGYSYAMPIGEFPVLIITATEDGERGAQNQAQWLGLSPDSRQVVIEGPHDLQFAAPEEVAGEIVDLLTRLGAG